MAILEVRDLEVTIGSSTILRGISFDLEAGQTLGVVGESGCGKSMTGFAVMGMLPAAGCVSNGSIKLDGRDLTSLDAKGWQEIRGKQIALVMQDPFTSLNPMMRIGDQIAEVFMLHQGFDKKTAWAESVKMLDRVGVPAPESAASRYPHQLSGGQRQRVVIAIAFACKPKVLIADEPTTALDVTLQAQILRLILELKETEGTAVMLISHDIGVIGALSKRIAVVYAGRVVESGPSEEVLRKPAHPYTRALLAALPNPDRKQLDSIPGQPPDLRELSSGCAFAPRCPLAGPDCTEQPPLQIASKVHFAACWRVNETISV